MSGTPRRTATVHRDGAHDLILAIDPGTTGMGYAVLDARREPARLVDHGLVAAPGSTAGARLHAIATAIDALISTHVPATLAIERLYFNKNVRTAMAVAEARGVALLCAARAGVAVAEYTPQEVKLSVTGTGAADKKQVQRMVVALLALAHPIAQDNVADAIAIALTHVRRARWDAVLATAGGVTRTDGTLLAAPAERGGEATGPRPRARARG